MGTGKNERAVVDQHLGEILVSNTEDMVDEVDLTESLSDDEIQALFDAFDDEDWAEVDRLIDAIDLPSAYDLIEDKAGGADRNSGGAEKLRRYWTVGEGAAKIRWGTEGDWTRCVEHLSKYLGPRAKGYCSLRHKERNGFYPGDKRNLKSLLVPILSPVIVGEGTDTTTLFAVPAPRGRKHTDIGVTVKAARLDDDTPFSPPSDVLRVGDCFKVVGPDAMSYVAEVVDLKTFRNWTDEDFVGKSMDRYLGVAVVSTDGGVAVPVDGSGEQPTATLHLVGASKKSIFDGAAYSFGHAPDSTPEQNWNKYGVGDKRNKSASPTEMGTASLYHGSKHDESPDIGESMTIEHKTVGVKGLNVVDATQGIVETVISVTGMVDNVKDRIMPGAYQKTLATRTPKGVWSHDWNEPVSKTLFVKELMPGDSDLPKKMPDGRPWPTAAGALKVQTQFNLETQRGREAFSDVVFFGEEQEWSIGYQVPVGGAKVDPQSGVREINFLELYEYSPVLFGAMPLARTTSVKDAQMAFKAIMEGGAASWVHEAAAKSDDMPEDDMEDVVDDEDEEVAEYGDEEDDEDMEGKSYLSGDQMMLVKSAIQTLSDLLEVVEAEYKVAEDIENPDDMADEDMEDEGDDEGDYGSLAEAVDDIAGDMDAYDDLSSAAEGIDSAVANDDSQGLEAASVAYLDAIEQNMGGDDDDSLQELAQILGDMIEQISAMSPEDGDGADAEGGADTTADMQGKEAMCPDCDKPMSECECDNPGKPEASTLLNADEIKSALAAFEL